MAVNKWTAETILLPENRGSSVGRNMLIRESQGDILLRYYISRPFAYLKKRLSEPAGNWRNWFQSMALMTRYPASSVA